MTNAGDRPEANQDPRATKYSERLFFSRCDDPRQPSRPLRRMSTSTTPLATSQTTVAKDAGNQSVFPAGNGRFFASVRTGGSTRFLGTLNSAVDANSAVARSPSDRAKLSQFSILLSELAGWLLTCPLSRTVTLNLSCRAWRCGACTIS